MIDDLRRALSSPELIRAKPFSILKQLCQLINSLDEDRPTTQELILRALEHRTLFGSAVTILDGLVREVGLFPYLQPDQLSDSDRLAFEAHRPPDLDKVVFHHPQAKVFHTIMSGRSVVLSAPTSFGKSLIIDAIVATRRFKNIVVVVPTLALIDETRRRLAQFRDSYAIVTQASQKLGDRNIFVMTQERILDAARSRLENVDFFVIDEFYKLSPNGSDDQRSALLNQVFYTLSRKCKHFYLLGPGIRGISEEFKQSLRFEFFHEPYHTVVSELHYVQAGKKPLENLRKLAESLKDPTLVFCSSPERAKTVAESLPDSADVSALLRDAAKWLGEHYHADWHVTRALQRGIGIHHGRVPRALAQFVVRAFNEEKLRYLVCTSTLIEGVNTKAKNIIVFDHTINKQAIDLFTFNNIRGRSGRMFQHYVGHVYVFHSPPQEGLPDVDVPAFTQGPAASDGLLIQIDPADLSDEAEERIRPYQTHPELPFSVIKENVGVAPEEQVALAEELSSDPAGYSRKLSWTGIPSYDDLLPICELIWTFFGGSRLGASSARTAKQLTMMLRQLHGRPSIAEFVKRQLKFSGDDADLAVRSVLDFQRLWATFHFPKLLRAIGRIQEAVFSKRGYSVGKYDQYAALVEHLFLNPPMVALEEYGIPLPLARKLGRTLEGEDMDQTLQRLKSLRVDALGLSQFERALVDDARRHA